MLLIYKEVAAGCPLFPLRSRCLGNLPLGRTWEVICAHPGVSGGALCPRSEFMLLSLLAFLLLNSTVPSTVTPSISTSRLKMPSTAATQQNAAIIYSDHGGFMISVPQGWVLDRATGQKMGTCCVLYPQGSSWDHADSVIYPNIAAKQQGQSLQELMASDLDGFRQRFPKMNVVEAKDLPP